MAVSAFAVAFIFAFTVSGVGGCDPNNCCCPNGALTALQAGSVVSITFSAVSGSGCPQGAVATSCQVSSNVCSTSSGSGSFDFSATKNDGAVSVTDRNDASCSMNLQCSTTTPGCENTNIWTGAYTAGGSKGVVVSVTCLLIVILSGILI